MKLLGRLPMKSTRKALNFSDFAKFMKIPPSQTYWRGRKPIPLRSYGNLTNGCCTIAKQAVAATRMERLETRRTLHIEDDEVLRVYFAMTTALYGGGDTGAYEDDALNRWRNPDLTFRDKDGNPYTIDAYLRLNPKNLDEVKAALAFSGAKGIAFCMNLPRAYETIDPPRKWELPKDDEQARALVGKWQPGTWGGHSLWGNGYTTEGPISDHTWEMDNNVISWEAWAAYADEAHVVIDSLDWWRQRAKEQTAVKINMADVRDAVNGVSSIRI